MTVLFICSARLYCAGQAVWENYGGPDGSAVASGGMFRLPDGRWALNMYTYTDHVTLADISTQFIALEEDQLVEIPIWDTTGLLLGPFHPHWSLTEPGCTFSAFPFDANEMLYGIISVNVDADLQFIRSKHFRFPQGTRRRWGGGGALLRDSLGRLISLHDVQLSASPTDIATIFAMVDHEGDSVRSRIYPSPLGTRDMCETENGYAVLFEAALEIGPPGRSKVLYFDEHFDHTGGFALNGIPGSPPVAGLDGDLYFHEMHRLASGAVLIATTFSSTATGMLRASPFLFKYSREGVLLDTLRGLPLDIDGGHRNYMSSLTELSDGTILWHFVEAMVPEYQSHDHFMKVDTALTILSDFVIEGVLDTYYYTINGVEVTDDGGLLVCGRAVLGAGQQDITSYLAKFAGFATHATDQRTAPALMVFPNPGEYCNVRPITPDFAGVLEVTDSRGVLVHRSTLRDASSVVVGQAWSSGLYHFRLLDHHGQVQQTGKWVRE